MTEKNLSLHSSDYYMMNSETKEEIESIKIWCTALDLDVMDGWRASSIIEAKIEEESEFPTQIEQILKKGNQDEGFGVKIEPNHEYSPIFSLERTTHEIFDNIWKQKQSVEIKKRRNRVIPPIKSQHRSNISVKREMQYQQQQIEVNTSEVENIKKNYRFDLFKVLFVSFCKEHQELIPSSEQQHVFKEKNYKSFRWIFDQLALFELLDSGVKMNLKRQFISHLEKNLGAEIQNKYLAKSEGCREMLRQIMLTIIEAIKECFNGSVDVSLKIIFNTDHTNNRRPKEEKAKVEKSYRSIVEGRKA